MSLPQPATTKKNIVWGGGHNTATRRISWDITNFPDFWTSQLTFILKIKKNITIFV